MGGGGRYETPSRPLLTVPAEVLQRGANVAALEKKRTMIAQDHESPIARHFGISGSSQASLHHTTIAENLLLGLAR